MAIFRLLGIRGQLEDDPSRPFMGDHATFPRQGDQLVDENGNPVSFSSMVGVPFDLVIDPYEMEPATALLWFDSDELVLKLSVKLAGGEEFEMVIDDRQKFMLKSVYDTNEDGIVNMADSLAYISGDAMFVIPAETVRLHIADQSIHFVIDDQYVREDAVWSSYQIADYAQGVAAAEVDARIQDYLIDPQLLWSSEKIEQVVQGLAPAVHTHDASQIVSGVLARGRLPLFVGTDGVSPGFIGAVPAPLPAQLDYFLRANGEWDYLTDGRLDLDGSETGDMLVFNGFRYRRTVVQSGLGLNVVYDTYDDTLTFDPLGLAVLAGRSGGQTLIGTSDTGSLTLKAKDSSSLSLVFSSALNTVELALSSSDPIFTIFGSTAVTRMNYRLLFGHSAPLSTERLELDTGILLGNSTGTVEGVIRFTGSDFEGYVGGMWRSFVGISTLSIDDLVDVDTLYSQPGDLFIFDGQDWRNTSLLTGGGVTAEYNPVERTLLLTGTPGIESLASLSDTSISYPQDLNLLLYYGGAWENVVLSVSGSLTAEFDPNARELLLHATGGSGSASYLSQLLDVSISSPQETNLLLFDGGDWKNVTLLTGGTLTADYTPGTRTLLLSATGGSSSVQSLDDLVDVSISYPEVGEVFMYDGEHWGDFKLQLLGLDGLVNTEERTLTLENTGVVVSIGQPVDAPPGTLWIEPGV